MFPPFLRNSPRAAFLLLEAFRRPCFPLLLLAAVLSVSCTQPSHRSSSSTTATTSKPPPSARQQPLPRASRTIEALPNTPEQRLGVVRVIGARGSFVLIETPSAAATAAIPAGRLLHCHPAGVASGTSTADLRVSSERRQPFVVADVVAGSPSVGDVAYVARDAEPAPVPVRPVVPFSSVIPAAEPGTAPTPTP